MDYDIERRNAATLPTSKLSSAARYINPGMTCAVALACICEGLRFAPDPAFATGGALAGTLIALGILGLSMGLSGLWIAIRERRAL
jgi:hypothetical protein